MKHLESLDDAIETFVEEAYASATRFECDVSRLHEKLLAHVEQTLILRVLEKHEGNKAQSARSLGLNRQTLRNKLKDYSS